MLLEERVLKLQKVIFNLSYKPTSKAIGKSKSRSNSTESLRKPFLRKNIRSFNNIFNAHFDSKLPNKKYFDYMSLTNKRKVKKSKRSRNDKNLSAVESMMTKGQTLKPYFTKTQDLNMSVQLVPQSCIGNKNNNKFGSLIDGDISSEDDGLAYRNTLSNQEFTPSLNQRMGGENILSNLKNELKLDENISFDMNNLGNIPIINQPDTPMVISNTECICKFTNKHQISQAEMKLEISYSDLGSVISNDQDLLNPQNLDPESFNENSKPGSKYGKFLGAEDQKKVVFRVLKLAKKIDSHSTYQNAISSEWWQKWGDYVNIEFFNPIDFKDFERLETLQSKGRNSINKEMRIGSYFKTDKNNDDLEADEIGFKQELTGYFESSIDPSLNDFKDDDQMSNTNSVVYNKPGKIINKTISKYNPVTQAIGLKSGMKEIYDFVLIHSKGWKYLSSWYEGDNPVYVCVKYNA